MSTLKTYTSKGGQKYGKRCQCNKKFSICFKKSFEIFMNDNLKPFKISSAQAKFLFILYENKKLRQSTLSKLAQCDKSYTHCVVKELLEKNL